MHLSLMIETLMNLIEMSLKGVSNASLLHLAEYMGSPRRKDGGVPELAR